MFWGPSFGPSRLRWGQRCHDADAAHHAAVHLRYPKLITQIQPPLLMDNPLSSSPTFGYHSSDYCVFRVNTVDLRDIYPGGALNDSQNPPRCFHDAVALKRRSRFRIQKGVSFLHRSLDQTRLFDTSTLPTRRLSLVVSRRRNTLDGGRFSGRSKTSCSARWWLPTAT